MYEGAYRSPFSRQPPDVKMAPQKPCEAREPGPPGSGTPRVWVVQDVVVVWNWTRTSIMSTRTPRAAAQFAVPSFQVSRARKLAFEKSARSQVWAPHAVVLALEPTVRSSVEIAESGSVWTLADQLAPPFQDVSTTSRQLVSSPLVRLTSVSRTSRPSIVPLAGIRPCRSKVVHCWTSLLVVSVA